MILKNMYTHDTISANQLVNISVTPQSFLVFLGNPSLPSISPHQPPPAAVTIDLFSFLRILYEQNLQCVIFFETDCFLKKICPCGPSRLLPVSLVHSFHLLNSFPLMEVPGFVQPFTCGRTLACSKYFAITNQAAKSIPVQAFV